MQLIRHGTDARAWYEALNHLVRVYQSRDRQRICYHDISVTQCHALSALLRAEGMRLDALAAELVLDKSTASRAVDGLERKGYVRRNPDPVDGRALRIEATPRGRQLHARIERELVEEQALLLAEFSPAIRASATRLLRKVAANAERKFRPERRATRMATCGPSDEEA